MDPLEVLKTDYFGWAVREVAAEHVAKLKIKAQGGKGVDDGG